MIDLRSFRRPWIVDLLWALALLVPAAIGRCATHPGAVTLSDEIDYVDSALVLLELATLETRAYYDTALLTQSPPLRPPHTPGQALYLAGGYALMGIDRGDIVADERLAVAPNLLAALTLLFLTVSLVRRATRSRGWAIAGGALVATQPALFLFAGLAMAELPFAAITLIVLAVLLARAGPVPWWREPIEAILLVAGVLVRPSLLLILVVYLPIVVQQRGWRGLRVLLWIVAFTAAAVPLATGRIAYPGSTFNEVIGTSVRAPIAGLELMLENLWKNIERFWGYTPSLRYNLQKIALWLTLATAVGLAHLARADRTLWRSVRWLIVINTLFLLATYDNYSWRGLRASSHLVAPALCVITIALARLADRGKRFAIIAVAAVLGVAASQVTVVAVDQSRRNDTVAGQLSRWQAAAPTFAALVERNPRGVFYVERGLERARLIHPGPRFVWVPRRRRADIVVEIARALPPDAAIGRGGRLASAAATLGLVEIDSPEPLRVWVRIE